MQSGIKDVYNLFGAVIWLNYICGNKGKVLIRFKI